MEDKYLFECLMLWMRRFEDLWEQNICVPEAVNREVLISVGVK